MTGATTPLIILDDRQPEWQAKVLRQVGFAVHVRRLPAGDLLWTSPTLGTVGIEDKPLIALLSDLRTGVLDDELRRLCDEVRVPVLMVRGIPPRGGALRWPSPYLQDKFGDWSAHALDNLLVGRQLRGLVVAWCSGQEDFAARVSSLYRYLERGPKEPDLSAPRQRYPWLGPLTGRAEVIFALLGQVQGLRNRRKLALDLASRVSLTELLRWDADEFRKAGFTKLMAGRIAEAIRRLDVGEGVGKDAGDGSGGTEAAEKGGHRRERDAASASRKERDEVSAPDLPPLR